MRRKEKEARYSAGSHSVSHGLEQERKLAVQFRPASNAGFIGDMSNALCKLSVRTTTRFSKVVVSSEQKKLLLSGEKCQNSVRVGLWCFMQVHIKC